jgi:hypothetical protein
MRILLREPRRRLYFRNLGSWTGQVSKAYDFGTLDDVVEIASGLGLKDCEVVVLSGESGSEKESERSWFPSC